MNYMEEAHKAVGLYSLDQRWRSRESKGFGQIAMSAMALSGLFERSNRTSAFGGKADIPDLRSSGR